MHDIYKKLEKYNNPEFKFEPIEHKYTLNGEPYISVTQFLSRFHTKFDELYWAKIKAEQAGISVDEMLSRWKLLNSRANIIGTATHEYIENYYNKKFQEIPTDLDIVDRINKFNIIYASRLHKLKPIKFEQRVYSEKWKISGTMDALFELNGNLIGDWKTNKEFTTDDDYKGRYNKLLYPFEEYYQNHLNEYSIQTSMYKLILKEVGIDIKSAFLVHIGPNTEAKIHKTHDFSGILEKYLQDEKNKLN